MGERLRVIGDPVVAGAPAGVRIRTRIHPTVAEAEALAADGELLGSVYRRELAGRVGLGRWTIRPTLWGVRSEAGPHGGVVVAVGRCDHPGRGGSVPAGDAGPGRPGSESARRGGGA